MSFFSRKQSDSGFSLFRLVFSVGLPLLLVLAFFATQFLNFNDIGLSNGFSHPLSGWDHLVTMLAVGVWAAQLRGRAVWMLPLAFVSVMSLGGLAGAAGMEIPHVDGIILISCAVFSVLITRNIRFSNKINILIVAFFAFFHGFAHGQEISTSASLISYTLGFMLATLLLHGAGILLAKLVVLAATCLLTMLFSNAALAKSADAAIDCKAPNPVVKQLQTAVNPGYVWLTPEQLDYKTDNPGFAAAQPATVNFTRLQNDGGGGALSGTHKTLKNLQQLADWQKASDRKTLNTGGDYAVITATPACLHAVHPLFYPGYSSDCSNLDFKNYYPKINHTPGRHFLSNGVGLTSPPARFSCFDVPRPFQNTAFSLVDYPDQPISFTSHIGCSSVTKPLIRQSKYLDPDFALSLIGRQFLSNKFNQQACKTALSLYLAAKTPNSFATDALSKRYRLSATPKKRLLFNPLTSTKPSLFSTKQSINSPYNTIKINT